MAKQAGTGTGVGDQPRVTQKSLRQEEKGNTLSYRQPRLGSPQNQRSYRNYSRG